MVDTADWPRFRIGQVSVYFGLFDQAMPPWFREDREAHAEWLTGRLSAHGEVVFPGLIDSDEAARAAGRTFAEQGVDALVVAPAMAAPPSYAWAVASAVPDVPVLVVGAQELDRIPSGYDTEEATRRSLPVGTVMVTNVLVREARPFLVVVGTIGSEEFELRLERALVALRAAAQLRRARLGVIGAPISGYLDVEVSDEQLAALGPAPVRIGGEELTAAFAGVEQAQVDGLVDRLRGRFETTAVGAGVLDRSARLALALEGLCDRHLLGGGTINCHSDLVRWNPEVGVTACLGVTLLSEAGTPFSCTGDVPTAAALVLGQSVAPSALYCELYAMDEPGNWMLVANGGEGDPRAREEGSPVELLPEEHYEGACGAGTAAAFPIARGPATLTSLSPAARVAGGWVLVVAEGEILGSEHAAMEGPNGMFRFASGAVSGAYARWCEAGATHHAALLPGHRFDLLADVGRLLGIDVAPV